MTHPLIETLSKTDGTSTIGLADLKAYLGERSDCLTLVCFPGHGMGKLETPDVAVVLIELKKIFGDLVRVGVASAEDERAMMGPCAVLMLPSISVFHGETHLKTLPKIQDWEVYTKDLPDLLRQVGLLKSTTTEQEA